MPASRAPAPPLVARSNRSVSRARGRRRAGRTHPSRRWLAVLPLVLALVGLGARRAGANDATFRNLLERAVQVLREAERHYYGDPARAAPLARRALLLLEQAEVQKPAEPLTALLGVQASVFASDRAQAGLWLERYAARTPYRERDPNLHYARGLVLLYLERRPELAVRALVRMRSLSQGPPERAKDTLYYAALRAEAELRLERGENERGIQALQEAVRLATEMGDRAKQRATRARIGNAYLDSGRASDAQIVFRRLAEEEPEAPHWVLASVASLRAEGKLEEARALCQDLSQRAEHTDVDPIVRAALQTVWLEQGAVARELALRASSEMEREALLAEALGHLERFVAAQPDSARGHTALGVLLYEHLARPYEALEHLQRAHALDPACELPLRTLVKLSTRHGPPPLDGVAPSEEARTAWDRQRAAWRRELETEAARRAQIRADRRAARDGDDGCE